MEVLLIALALIVAGGLLALALSRTPAVGTIVAVSAVVAGCSLGLISVIEILTGGPPSALRINWDEPHGSIVLEVDALSAFFLLPALVISALSAVYGGSYLSGAHGRKPIGAAWFFFTTFVGGMVLVLVARSAVLFLIAWELMSLAAFLLVCFDHERREVRRAGWVYLIATHLGVALILALFTLLGRYAGGIEFADFLRAPSRAPGIAGLLFVVALAGFGAKAGLFPVHVWLPDAHAAAPSHVSALMSGVMIKMGIYGILRTLTFLGPAPPWWGIVLVAVGGMTALVGIALATCQSDLKRILAYSSIENMGLITLALGLALWAEAVGQPLAAALALTACLLHVWNHAGMKALMFLAAGSVLHGAGSRDIERLGGLMKRMPWTGAAMLVGAVAIAALPPLNGFAGKWLTYLALFECALRSTNDRGLTFLALMAFLALIGGLSAITFVRACGIALLGTPRSDDARHAHESSWWMRGPMVLLVIACLAAGVFPDRMAGFLIHARDQVLRPQTLPSSVPTASLAQLGAISFWMILAITFVTVLLAYLTRRAATGPTWGCAYVAPSPRMQYTGRSFAEMLAERVFPRSLRPKSTKRLPEGIFPAPGSFASESSDPMLGKIYEPFFAGWADRFLRLRVLQRGKVHVYLLYILVTVVLALGWSSVRKWVWLAHE